MLQKELGMRVRELRTKRKESLRSFAKKINISFSALQKIETGQNFPSMAVLNKIADELEVEPSYLFGDGEKNEIQTYFSDKVEWVGFVNEMVDEYKLRPEDLKKIIGEFLKKNGQEQ